MKNSRYLTFKHSLFALLIFGLIPLLGLSQTQVFNVDGNALPSSWTGVNNVNTHDIQRSGYFLLDAGNPSDEIITATYDLSSYNSAVFNFDVATFGGASTNNPATIKISYDGGNTFTQTETSSTPSSSTYIGSGDITLSSVSANVVIKLINGATGRGVRLKNLILTGSSGGSTAPSISNINQTPIVGNVTTSDAVSVSADITDNDGIGNVELSWGTTSGNLTNNINMSLDSGDTYTTDTDIPVQNGNVTVYYEIEAIDNNSETTTSPEQNYTVHENPPGIANYTITPSSPTSSNDVSVSADITDNDGVSQAELRYGTTSGNLTTTINMSLGSGDTYTTDTDIPAQNDNVTVYYEIYALDNNNEATTSPEQSYTVQDPISTPDLIISEVADPTDDYQARFVEIYNNGSSPIDFNNTTVYLAKYANGNTNATSVQLTGTIAAGDFYVIGKINGTFDTRYGISADIYSGVVDGNGDDDFVLYVGGDEDAGTLFDIYGEIGVDGTGELWEYENSRAVRNDLGVTPKTTWVASEWTITSANAADMTPGAGEGAFTYDFTYDNGSWTPSDPNNNATASDDILVKNGTASFTENMNVKSLTVNSGASLTVEQILDINGNIVNDGNLIFKSDVNGTGELGTVPAGATVTGSGEAQVQRRFTGRRAYRYVSSPVTTINSSKSTINANWQEGVHNTDYNYGNDPNNPDSNSNINLNPGYGTHITGSTTGANGFDATETGNASLYTYDNSNPGFISIDNTDNTSIDAGTPYVMVIRGSRGVNLNFSNQDQTDNSIATILRTTGDLKVGDFTPSAFSQTSGDFNLIGNPYQSAVDINSLLNGSTGLATNQYYVFDPTLGDYGSYVLVDLPSGSNTSNSSANEYLQPFQAFMIETTGTSPSLTFTETDKAPGHHTATFSTNGLTGHGHIFGQLYTTERYLADSTMQVSTGLLFDESFSNAVLDNDAPMPGNFSENFGSLTDGNYLALERRELPEDEEQIQLFINQYGHEDYMLVMKVGNLPDDITAYLQDNYTGESHELQEGENPIQFQVDLNSENGSTDSQRFALAFEENALGLASPKDKSIVLYPNPLPSGDAFVLNAGSHGGETVTITVSNLNGAAVHQETTVLGTSTRVAPGNLASGVYIVKVAGKSFTTNKKLIIK